MSTMAWNPIGNVPIASLTEARLQLHWAAQIPASCGNALLERRTDDSQSNLGWADELKALCSHSSPEHLRVGLRLADLTLFILKDTQKVSSEIRLKGKTLHQGFEWVTATYASITGAQPEQPFALREYEMPPHPVQQSAVFSPEPPAAFQEYQHWFANGHHMLQELTRNWPQASPVRCWPHHFDIGSLIIFDQHQSAEEARSVGCGLSPGDTTYPEPYWYVNPWPYPEKSLLPNLKLGKWHTEGWIGAILTATDLVEGGSVPLQPDRVHQFLHAATQACFSILGAHPQER